MGYVRQARLSDAYELAPTLRQADLDELAATRDTSPFHALAHPFTDPTAQTYSMIGDKNEVVGMFGVNDQGAVWMLSADALYDRYRRQFMKQTLFWIEVLQGPRPIIYNYVDTRNTRAIRWLRYCGFTVAPETVPYGPDQMPFHLLFREKGN